MVSQRATLSCAQCEVAAPHVKVATFNINDVNKRFQNLSAWLTKTEPDVVCLQELKAEQEAFPADKLRALGYEAVWRGERSWNGVAILARDCVPVLTRSSLPGDLDAQHKVAVLFICNRSRAAWEESYQAARECWPTKTRSAGSRLQ